MFKEFVLSMIKESVARDPQFKINWDFKRKIFYAYGDLDLMPYHVDDVLSVLQDEQKIIVKADNTVAIPRNED